MEKLNTQPDNSQETNKTPSANSRRGFLKKLLALGATAAVSPGAALAEMARKPENTQTPENAYEQLGALKDITTPYLDYYGFDQNGDLYFIFKNPDGAIMENHTLVHPSLIELKPQDNQPAVYPGKIYHAANQFFPNSAMNLKEPIRQHGPYVFMELLKNQAPYLDNTTTTDLLDLADTLMHEPQELVSKIESQEYINSLETTPHAAIKKLQVFVLRNLVNQDDLSSLSQEDQDYINDKIARSLHSAYGLLVRNENTHNKNLFRANARMSEAVERIRSLGVSVSSYVNEFSQMIASKNTNTFKHMYENSQRLFTAQRTATLRYHSHLYNIDARHELYSQLVLRAKIAENARQDILKHISSFSFAEKLYQFYTSRDVDKLVDMFREKIINTPITFTSDVFKRSGLGATHGDYTDEISEVRLVPLANLYEVYRNTIHELAHSMRDISNFTPNEKNLLGHPENAANFSNIDYLNRYYEIYAELFADYITAQKLGIATDQTELTVDDLNILYSTLHRHMGAGSNVNRAHGLEETKEWLNTLTQLEQEHTPPSTKNNPARFTA